MPNLPTSIEFKATLSQLIDTNDFDVFAHPIRRQVYPTAVATRLDFLFDQLFPEDSKLGLGIVAGPVQLPVVFFQVRFFFQSDHRFHSLAAYLKATK